MNRHDFFKQRLETLGMYDKDSDYDGLIGKWVEELSLTWSKQRHSGQSAIITHQLFNKLMIEYGGKDMLPPDPQSSVTSVQDSSTSLRADGGGGIVGAWEKLSPHPKAIRCQEGLALALAIEARFEIQEARNRVLLSKVGELGAEIKEVDKRRYTDSKRISDHYQEFDNLKAEIEGVRKEVRNHEERLKTIETMAPVQDQQILDLDADTTNLERKVEELGKAIEGLENWQTRHPESHKAIKQTTDWLYHQVAIPEEEKPQPAIAQAPDKDGKMHDLKPRQTFLKNRINDMVYLFDRPHGSKGLLYAWNLELQDAKSQKYLVIDFIWLRDLDFPPFDKSQDVGGDKERQEQDAEDYGPETAGAG